MNEQLVVLFTYFVLAIFIGFEVVSKVPTILHTPLMSGSNAIHGIILVGALLIAAHAQTPGEIVLGFLAVVLATINVVGDSSSPTACWRCSRADGPVERKGMRNDHHNGSGLPLRGSPVHHRTQVPEFAPQCPPWQLGGGCGHGLGRSLDYGCAA